MRAVRKVAVVGSSGFVGSAICKFLRSVPDVHLYAINRENFGDFRDVEFDVLIEAACNSKKYLADEDPFEEAELSLMHRVETLTRFRSRFHIHLSSVDVYSELSDSSATQETAQIDIAKCSNYGAHKLLAEQLVRHYAKDWIIFRLSGMVGIGLRKNPVFDILQSNEIFIHPKSQYQFCNTAFVASAIWMLYQAGCSKEIFNIAGQGLISPEEIFRLRQPKPNESLLYAGNDKPRIVHVNTQKLEGYLDVPDTKASVAEFMRS